MKKVIVTGGLGFVGRNLVDELLSRGVDEIYIVDDCSNSEESLCSHWPIDRVFHDKLSVLDQAWMSRLDEYDTVFHLACKTLLECGERPVEDLEVNTKSTIYILEHIRKLPADRRPRFVYTSSACVYGKTPQHPISESYSTEPNHQYGASKLASEKYVSIYSELYGIDAVTLRLSNVYGRYQTPSNPYCGVVGKFINEALGGKQLVVFGDGTQTRDFTYADDTVRVMCDLAEQESRGDVYNISTGSPVSVNHLAQSVLDLVGEGDIKHEPPRSIDNIVHRWLDSSKMKKHLNISELTRMDEGLRATVDWVKSQKIV